MRKTFKIKIIVIAVFAFLFSSCSENKQSSKDIKGKEYSVMILALQPAKLSKDYTATLEGEQTVEIRPKISGYIDKVCVDEGAHVKKGQLLFRLNDKDLRAAYLSCAAQVKVAEAQVTAAKVSLNKTRPLAEKNIVSKFDLESAEAALKANEAQLAQAKANLSSAKANLDYTLITSPAEGNIGTFPYRVGSLVSSTNTEPLTTISNTKKVYAYFSLNEKEFLTLTKDLKGRTIQEKLARLPGVSLVMADNSVYEHSGRIETASGLIDKQTGTVNVRASFLNPEGRLRSGGSGTVRIPQNINSALIIPQKAAFEIQGKYFVFIAGPDNKVVETEVEVLTGNLKDSYIVTGGLKSGDRIVLEGVASLHNGTKIIPKLADAGSH
jgi:membrane fusion protein (multidrug efflux system)